MTNDEQLVWQPDQKARLKGKLSLDVILHRHPTRVPTRPRPTLCTTLFLGTVEAPVSFPFFAWENLSQAQHYFSSRPLNSLTPATHLPSKFLFIHR
ncbi:hypothetical protein M3J09_002140 [Ascochyta lentis]